MSVYSNIMRAIRVHRFGGPEVLSVEDNVPIPNLDHDKILVRVMSAGVNPVETYIRSGTYSRKPQLPYTPGADLAGIVEKVGKDVQQFKKGERVFCSRKVEGSYAEYCSVPVDSCWHLPDQLTFSQGASIGVPYFTAYRALFQKANAKAGQTVLVHGASGAVGLAAVQMAKAVGMKVLGTGGSEEGLKLIKENGADLTFNHKDPNYFTQIMDVTCQNGVDVILEMLSNVNLGKDLEVLADDGTVVIVGCRGSVEINPRLMMGKESKIVGVALMKAKDAEWREMGSAVCAGLASGVYVPVVDKEYPMDNVAQAHRDVIEHVGAKGKLVLTINSS